MHVLTNSVFFFYIVFEKFWRNETITFFSSASTFFFFHFTAYNREKKCKIYSETLVRQTYLTTKDFIIVIILFYIGV